MDTGVRFEREPVREVVTHVIPAEGVHPHRVELDIAERAVLSSGALRRHDRAKEDPVLPRARLHDERYGGGAADTEDDGIDRYAARLVPFWGK
jgi:hypothetical protein